MRAATEANGYGKKRIRGVGVKQGEQKEKEKRRQARGKKCVSVCVRERETLTHQSTSNNKGETSSPDRKVNSNRPEAGGRDRDAAEATGGVRVSEWVSGVVSCLSSALVGVYVHCLPPSNNNEDEEGRRRRGAEKKEKT